MLSAAVDVGSNTLRLLIGSVRENRVIRLYTGRWITRLGEGVKVTGALTDEAMRRSLAAMTDFSRVIKRHRAISVKAVGTSALREAKNNQEFIASVVNETGIQIEIISGEREAELTAHGVLTGLPESGNSYGIVDIGGGSTEWIRLGNPLRCGSAPLGVVNLSEQCIKTDPPSQDDITTLIGEIDASFSSDAWGDFFDGNAVSVLHLPGRDRVRFIGTGGTITTLAAIDLRMMEYDGDMVHLHAIPLTRLHSIRDLLTSLPLRDRRHVIGLEAGRADLIIPGILLTIKLLEKLGLDRITSSDYGILEGLLKETCHEKSL